MDGIASQVIELAYSHLLEKFDYIVPTCIIWKEVDGGPMEALLVKL